MNKGIILLSLTIFSVVGSYIPMLLGDDGGLLGGWSILGGFVGGAVGIWLGVVASRWVE
jgi:hypothetical protein